MVSIHAPVRGATLCAYAVVTTPVFQSTPLFEGRLFLAWLAAQRKVSIHAPVRGATVNTIKQKL